MMQWDLYAIHEGVYYIVVKYIITHSVESNTTLGQAHKQYNYVQLHVSYQLIFIMWKGK